MCFNPETDISPMRCDQCGRVCRTGDAFCSLKCADAYVDWSLWAFYTHPLFNNEGGYCDHDRVSNNLLLCSHGAD